MQPKNDWYVFDGVAAVDSPQLIFYRHRIQYNIEQCIKLAGGTHRLRPHVKTHKTRQVALMQQEAGIRKFKCATIAEADMLGMNGAADVLLAYQLVGPKIGRFLSLIKRYPLTAFSCLIDHPVSAELIAAAGADAGVNIRVFIDLNVGMNRTGIAPNESALALYETCNSLKGIQAIGFHVYDGHIQDANLKERRKKVEAAFAPVRQLQQRLQEKGYQQPVLVAGGTPSFPVHAQEEDVECSPGTFVFWDAGYQQLYPEQPFVPAALVLGRVVSLPDERLVTLDLGHKSVAAENPLERRVHFLNAPEVIPISQSEEHLVVEAPAGHGYQIGDVFYGLPVHICPTVALYQQALVVNNRAIAEEWEIMARNRKIND